MGFTTWPPDFTPQAVSDMYKFMARHSDLIAHHFDGGVPWLEAFGNQQFSQNLMNDWSTTKANTPKGSKVYVGITPMDSSRQHLAKYWGSSDNMELPAPWNQYQINSPEVKKAYLNYARRVVDYFKPDYLAIGIEVNIALEGSTAWDQYKDLHQYIYTELKKSYSNLPIFATISLPHLDGLEGSPRIAQHRQAVQSILPYEDILALSSYPYGFAGREQKPVPDNFFDSALKFGKPVAVGETGCPSKDFRALLFKYKFNEEDQNQCISTIMKKAAENKFVFVVNWVAIDFDKMIAKFSAFDQSFASLFEYTGLENSDGTSKPALKIWDSYLGIPFANAK